MKSLIISSITIMLFITSPTYAKQTADLVIYNAKITTQNPKQPEATAVAIANGKVLAVGNEQTIRAVSDEKTLVIDAEGRRMIPGLNDNHIHALQGGASYNLNIQWDGVPSLERALNMLAEQAKRTPKGHWVKAIGGWSPHQFKEKRYPTMKELNQAVPNHPFIVQHAYNVAFVNQHAIDIFSKQAPYLFKLPQTRWEIDKDGKYTGVVYGEPASWVFWFMEYAVPATTNQEMQSSMQYLFRDLNRMGITSVSDAGVSDPYPQSDKIQSLFRNNQSTVRISFMELTSTGLENVITALTETAPIKPGENIHPHLAHGFQFEAVGEVLQMNLQTFQTISDFENFMQPIYHADVDYIYKTTLRDAHALLKKRIPFRIHATYNETISPILDALEELDKKTSFNGLRWSLEHAETISEDNIKRVAALGGAIAVQDRMAMHGDDFVNTNGIEKALQSPPMRTILEAKVPFSLGTDGLRASSFNPWVTMSWATTGKSVSGKTVLSQKNQLTREEALFAYTVGSAWHQYQEDKKGRIMQGQLADFALLNKDYFTVSNDDISSIHAVLTVVDGKIVYGEGAYAELDKDLPPALPAWSPTNFFTAY